MTSVYVFANDTERTQSSNNVREIFSEGSWMFSGQALYLKPGFTDELGTIGAVNFNVANASERFIDTDPSKSWGFRLEGSYITESKKDLNVNWYHLSGKNTVTNINDINAPTNYGFRQLGTETHSIKPKWDAVNIELGQQIEIKFLKMLRLYGGAQFVNIKASTSLDGYDSFVGFSSLNDYHTAKASTTYNGFGPRIGVDFIYPVINNLSVSVNFASAVLGGKSNFSRFYVDNYVSSPGFPSNSTANRTSVVVPELEGKLGANFNKQFSLGLIGLDVGYMWLTYINPLLFSQWKPVGNNQTLNVANMVNSESNFTLNGIYFGLKWVGNVI